MANFDDLNTVEISQQRAFDLAIEAETTRDFTPTIDGQTIGLSLGMSGNRGFFLVSKAERQLWAGTILAKALPRLDDILSERKSLCPCSSVFIAIETIEGRCNDIFWLPNLTGEKSIPIFPDCNRLLQ